MIDPELLLRILLIGYLYGITSERKLVEELRACIWRGAGLPVWGFDQEIPHHSTFSKNRHGRFAINLFTASGQVMFQIPQIRLLGRRMTRVLSAITLWLLKNFFPRNPQK